jgi:O-antigen/teichoic acid export membrane protein
VKKRFVKDLAIYAPSLLLPALTAFVTTPILTRLLAPAEYGYWAQATSVAGFLTALTATSLGSAALRFYPAYEASSNLDVFFATFAALVMALLTLVGGVSVLVLLILKELLPSWLVPLLPLVILIFVANSIFIAFISVIRAQGRSGAFTVFQLLSTYGGLGAGLLLVAAGGFRVEGLLWGTLVALVTALPFLVVVATRRVGVHPRASNSRSPLSYGVMHGPSLSEMWPSGDFAHRICSSSAHSGRREMWDYTRCPTTYRPRALNSW